MCDAAAEEEDTTARIIFSHWLILDIPLEIIKRSLVATESFNFLQKGQSTHTHAHSGRVLIRIPPLDSNWIDTYSFFFGTTGRIDRTVWPEGLGVTEQGQIYVTRAFHRDFANSCDRE